MSAYTDKMTALLNASGKAVETQEKAFTAFRKHVSKNEKGIIDDNRFMLVTFQEVDRLTTSTAEYYEQILKRLKANKVEWKDIVFHLQTVVFKGLYPLQDNGKPVSVRDCRAKNEYGRMINCFNTYRYKYSDYGVEKVKVEKSPIKKQEKSPTEKLQDEVDKTGSAKEETKPLGTARTFTLTDLQNVSANLLLEAAIRNGLVSKNKKAVSLLKEVAKELKIELQD